MGGAGRGGADRPERRLSDTIEAYAYARTGYHRGLDALRRNGWKGFGPVPWSHEPNRGFLRCVTVLARAAEAIGETDEHERCIQLLRDCDPTLSPWRRPGRARAGCRRHADLWMHRDRAVRPELRGSAASSSPGLLRGPPDGAPLPSSGWAARQSAAVMRGELVAAGDQPGQVGGVDVLPGEVAGDLAVRPAARTGRRRGARSAGCWSRTARPAPARRAATSDCSTRVCWATVSGAVGSSKTSARAPKCSARATARLCRSPARSALAGWSGSRPVTPTRASPAPWSRGPGPRRSAAAATTPRVGSAPSTKLRQTGSSGATARSCHTVAIPAARAGAACGTAPGGRRAAAALVGPAQAGHHGDQRRLARPVLPEHAGDLAGAQRGLTRSSAGMPP